MVFVHVCAWYEKACVVTSLSALNHCLCQCLHWHWAVILMFAFAIFKWRREKRETASVYSCWYSKVHCRCSGHCPVGVCDVGPNSGRQCVLWEWFCVLCCSWQEDGKIKLQLQGAAGLGVGLAKDCHTRARWEYWWLSRLTALLIVKRKRITVERRLP